MRLISISFIILSITTILPAQNNDLKDYLESIKQDTMQLNLVSVNGVKFYSTPEELNYCLGRPDSIVNPHYECGGFSEDWQQVVFLQHYYGHIIFIGCGNNLQLEFINFNKDTTITLKYREFSINGSTRIEDMSSMFPKSYKNRYIKNEQSLIEVMRIAPWPLSDDMVRFWFKNGILSKMEYWTPC